MQYAHEDDLSSDHLECSTQGKEKYITVFCVCEVLKRSKGHWIGMFGGAKCSGSESDAKRQEQ